MNHIDQRPDLNEEITVHDFLDFYWLKEELQSFCRKAGLQNSGSKPEISERIAHFLKTGEKTAAKKKQLPTSKFDWNTEILSTATLITDNYKNTENVRAFFTENIGKHFKFNTLFMNWMKQNAGKTLAEAIEEWKRIHNKKKNNPDEKDIAAQFEYNTYIRDFLKDNPGLSFADTRKYWLLKKQLRGNKKYVKEDLLLSNQNDKVTIKF